PPDPEETASPEQQQQTEDLEARDRLLPDNPINLTKLRGTDADAEFRGTEVQANDVPLDHVFLDMDLNNGHLQMTRLDFGVAHGTVTMQIFVNSMQSPIQARMAAKYNHIQLNKLLAPFEAADDAFGVLHGQASLWMQGESFA